MDLGCRCRGSPPALGLGTRVRSGLMSTGPLSPTHDPRTATALDTGPKHRWLLIIGTLVVFIGIAGTIVWVTRAQQALPSPQGVLEYQNAGVSGYGGYVVGAPYSIGTPPLVNVGKAPLTLQSIALISTGCRISVVSTGMFHFKGAGVELGPANDPRSQWSKVWGLTVARAEVRGMVLRPATPSAPSFKDVITFEVPQQGAIAIAGFRVRYVTAGVERTEDLRVAQALLPRPRFLKSAAMLLRRAHAALSAIPLSQTGSLAPLPCDQLYPSDLS